jgi:ketosteroid isomerase-like protein
MRPSLLGLSCLLLVAVSPAAGQNRDSNADRAAIRREVDSRTRAMIEAFERGDLRTVARFYADDARIYASGTAIEGRSEIDRFWLKIRHPVSWELETIDVGGSRDEPYQLVKSTMVDGLDRHKDTSFAICLLVWRREADGTLRIRIDLYANLSEAEFELAALHRRYGIAPEN